MLKVFFALNDIQLDNNYFTCTLPESIIKKSIRFVRWEDKQAFLIGRLLLKYGLESLRVGNNSLLKIKTNLYGKPFINEQIFFNISHSGKYVVCVFCEETVGIDIELIRAIDIDDFKNVLSRKEVLQIYKSNDPIKDFFRIWTVKESIVKAIGKGLSIPFSNVDIQGDRVIVYKSNQWFVRQLVIDPKYYCSIATQKRIDNFTSEQIDIDHLY